MTLVFKYQAVVADVVLALSTDTAVKAIAPGKDGESLPGPAGRAPVPEFSIVGFGYS